MRDSERILRDAAEAERALEILIPALDAIRRESIDRLLSLTAYDAKAIESIWAQNVALSQIRSWFDRRIGEAKVLNHMQGDNRK